MPSFLLEGDTPRLIDEWQLAPELWDAIRFAVDKRNAFGQFLLTGSSVPADLSRTSHTGTGRITRFKMRPMSLYESEDSNGKVSLNDLFQGADISAASPHSLEDIAYLTARGGWPGALEQEEKIALEQAYDFYTATVEADIQAIDGVRRSSEWASMLMRSIARNLAGQVSVAQYGRDLLRHADQEISDATLAAYLEALKGIFVLEDLPAWSPNLRSRTAIRTSPTRYFTDPSIAVASLGLGPRDLINNLETFGLLFENLCVRDIRVYSEVYQGEVYHYRDKNNLECDMVVHKRNGDYGLIEVKLGTHQVENASENLKKLESLLDPKKMKLPGFRMVITGFGYAYRRQDGTYVVPIGCLAP